MATVLQYRERIDGELYENSFNLHWNLLCITADTIARCHQGKRMWEGWVLIWRVGWVLIHQAYAPVA